MLDAGGVPLEFPVSSLGNLITLDVQARSLFLHVDDAELAGRRSAWVPPPAHGDRSYVRMCVDHVLQAN